MNKNFATKSVLQRLLTAVITLSLAVLPMSSVQAVSLASEADWQQVNPDGFGNPLTVGVTALEVFDGQIYAGASNWDAGGQVWRQQKNGEWVPVSDVGFGSGALVPAVLDLFIFQGRLYAGAGWGDAPGAPGQVWRSQNGQDWRQITTDGFGDSDNNAITSFTVFKGMLYAGTGTISGGAQVWRSKNGNRDSWTRVGIDQSALVGNVTGFAVYKNVLYAAIENQLGGFEDGPTIQIWRSTNGSDWEPVTLDGFGDAFNESTGGFAQFSGHLYVGTRNDVTGGQIWRTKDGLNWELAVGDGFGDPANIKIESLLRHNDRLYAVTFNELSGLQIWRSANGTTWRQVSGNGFGDSNNSATLWNNATAVHRGRILIGTWNDVAGGELWMSNRQDD